MLQIINFDVEKALYNAICSDRLIVLQNKAAYLS
jgi:hypothetical protein